MEKICANCKYKGISNRELICSRTNLPIQIDGGCDGYEQVDIEAPSSGLAWEKFQKQVSKVLLFVIGIIITIGLIQSGNLALDDDTDAAAFNYLFYCSLAMLAWLGCRHQKIRKYTFVFVGAVSIIFYLFLMIVDSFDDILVILSAFFIIFAFMLSYFKMYT